jgi:hypothetical protein
MATLSLARIAGVLQRDFRSTANQLRQEGKVVRDKTQACVDAANALDRLAATVRDVDPNLLLAYHELVAENPDRVSTPNCFGTSRSREKSRQRANISPRT